MQRRWSIVVVFVSIGLVASGCGTTSSKGSGPGSSTTAVATGPSTSSASSSTSGPTSPPASVVSTERILASSAIATVSDESSTAPLVPVSGPVRLTFTASQVQSMAAQVGAGGGLRGSALDRAVALPAGDPPFSYLLAAWVSKIATPGATAIRSEMGTQDWADAPDLVFPTLALPLFVSDVMSNRSAAPSSTKGQAGALGPVGAKPPAELVDFTSGPCTTVTGFIQGVLNKVFDGLMLGGTTVATGTGSAIASFFVTVWDVAVSLAQAVVQGLVSAITQAGVTAISIAAGAVAVVAQVTSYVDPWSISVTPTRQTLAAGSHGSVLAKVVAAGAAAYPSAISDCAADAGVTLPPLSGAGLAAEWSLTGAISAAGPVQVTLDRSGSGSMPFCAGSSCSGAAPPTSSQCNGSTPAEPTSPPDSGVATISVTRPGVDGLKQFVDGILAGIGTAGPGATIATSILQPIIDGVEADIAPLAQDVYGTAFIVVTGSPSTSTTAAPCSAPCMVGSWTQTNETVTGTNISGGAGGTYSISSTGQFTWNLDASAPTSGGDLNRGSGSGQVALPSDASATSGTWSLRGVTGVVTAHLADGQTQVNVYPFTTGTWTCSGDKMVVNSPIGGSTAILSATRDA